MAHSKLLVAQLRQQLVQANSVLSQYEQLITQLQEQLDSRADTVSRNTGILPLTPFFRGPTGERLIAGLRELPELMDALQSGSLGPLTDGQQAVIRQITRLPNQTRAFLELLQVPWLESAELHSGHWNLVPLLERHLPETCSVEGDRAIQFYANREVVRRSVTALAHLALEGTCPNKNPAAHVQVNCNAARQATNLVISFPEGGLAIPGNESFYWLPNRMVAEASVGDQFAYMVLLFAIQALGGQNAGIRISQDAGFISEVQIVLPQKAYVTTADALMSELEERERNSRLPVAILSCPENRQQTENVRDALSAAGRRILMLTPAEWQIRTRQFTDDVLMVPLPPTCCNSLQLIADLAADTAQEKPAAHLVPVAAFDAPGQREKCLDLGALAYFQQPLMPESLAKFLDGIPSHRHN